MEATGPSREATLAGRTQARQIKDPGFNAGLTTDTLWSLGRILISLLRY